MQTHKRRVKTRHIILAVMCLMYFISYRFKNVILCNNINVL